MNTVLIVELVLAWLAVVTGAWLGWQLLRQNGRILLRLDELEKRLNEFEFGEDEAPAGWPVGTGGEREGRKVRFKNRSLAHSKIKRDGLKAGTPAPDFRLPRLDGKGDVALSDFRGKRVLLVFSSPGCGPCNIVAPELEKFYRDQRETNGLLSPAPSSKGGEGEALAPVEVVMISKGEPKENHAKVKEHGLTFPVVLQQQWEISRRYAMFATPIAYAINEAGVIQADVAVGLDAILGLMSEEAQAPQPRVACRAHDSRNYFDAGAGEFVAGPWNERSTRLCGSLGAGTTTWP